MAIILNIDTALENAYVSLAENGKPLLYVSNDTQKDHAAWIQAAIRRLMKDADLDMTKLNAVGVSLGPGSYTGLRIGLSAAKGICYALNIPLITESSLKILACSAIKYVETLPPQSWQIGLLFCPMIDARRMEVFGAIYDSDLKEVVGTQAWIVNENSFKKLLERQKILFLGSGSVKFQPVCQNPNALFKKIPLDPFALSVITYKNFIGNNFADLTSTEPLYLKEFFVSDGAKNKVQ